MIPVNQLRIDNFVTAPRIGTCLVNGIQVHTDGFFVWVVADGMEFKHRVNIKDLTPIQLTPKILESCGFERRVAHAHAIGEYDWYEINDWALNWVHYEKCWVKFADADSIPIKHLHQLQNLYFALTGEDLEVNIPTDQPQP